MYIVQDHELNEFLGLQEPWTDLFIRNDGLLSNM